MKHTLSPKISSRMHAYDRTFGPLSQGRDSPLAYPGCQSKKSSNEQQNGAAEIKRTKRRGSWLLHLTLDPGDWLARALLSLRGNALLPSENRKRLILVPPAEPQDELSVVTILLTVHREASMRLGKRNKLDSRGSGFRASEILGILERTRRVVLFQVSSIHGIP